ncbi:MAG: reverse transcriptase domain-containing protein [Novosphingobium sp.]|uniref:reverse transcriptase domain-containing protein n=1 Tax=Novosphingobium sp. TaxID=1874826 RepID=UPI00301A961E
MAVARRYKTTAMSRLSGMGRQQQRSEIRRLLSSRRLARYYAYQAVLRCGQIGNATPASIEAIADQCDPFAPCRERTTWRHVQKGGKVRLVQQFRPIKRMMQAFVADIISAIHSPRAEQYLFHGGIPAALKAAEAAYTDGYTHAVEVDAVGFYHNVRQDVLAGLLLPLPAAVTHYVVCDAVTPMPSSTTTVSMRGISPLPDAQMGIPLGAGSSPVAGEVVIANLLAAAPTAMGCKIITYADNLLVFGRSAQEATENAEHLLTLASAPADPAEGASGSRTSPYPTLRVIGRGRFAGGGSSDDDFWAGVSFVGQVGEVQPDGSFSWRPSDGKMEEHSDADMLHTPQHRPIDRLAPIARITLAERKVAARRRAYPFWQDGDVWEARRLADLASARFLHQPNAANRAAACQALMVAFLFSGQSEPITDLIPDYGRRWEDRRQQLTDAANALLERIGSLRATDEAAE